MRVLMKSVAVRGTVSAFMLYLACASVPASAAVVTWKLTGTFLAVQNELSSVFNNQSTPSLTAFISFDNAAGADSSNAIQAHYGPGGSSNIDPNVTITYVAGNGSSSVSGTASGGSIDVTNDLSLVGNFLDQYSLTTPQQAPTGATGPSVTGWEPFYLRMDIFDSNSAVETMLTSTAIVTDPASMLLVNPGKTFYIFYTPAGSTSGQLSQALFNVDSITLVPLPGALVLMLSGLGLLATRRYRRARR